jgi:hypothetical protein
MGSLRTELQIPSTLHTAQSIEECAESDDDAEEDRQEEEDIVLGYTPQVQNILPSSCIVQQDIVGR